jgi:hypothetical protein
MGILGKDKTHEERNWRRRLDWSIFKVRGGKRRAGSHERVPTGGVKNNEDLFHSLS